MAVKNEGGIPELWLERFGPEAFLLGADVRDEKITIEGWLEKTDIWVYDFIRQYLDKGVITRFSAPTCRRTAPWKDRHWNFIRISYKSFPELHFIASGGVSFGR
jgi:phosphoribosylformimino-5-aminoimidazole carboxamide ribotide isomerase